MMMMIITPGYYGVGLVHPCCFSASQVSDSVHYSQPQGGSPDDGDDYNYDRYDDDIDGYPKR